MGLFSAMENKKRLTEKVDKGKSIIQRWDKEFDRTLSAVNSDIRSFNGVAQPLYNRKISILQKLGVKTDGIQSYDVDMIESFDSRYKPEFYSAYKDDFLSASSKTFLSGLIGGDDGGWLENADEFINDANEYKDELSADISKMNAVRANIEILKQHLNEESKLMSAIEDSLNTKRDTISAQVAKAIETLLAEQICDSSGQVKDRYKTALQGLSSISNAF